MIYLDHAATSHPKPPAVRDAIVRYLDSAGSPGRSGHRLAVLAEETMWSARQAAADLFEVKDPAQVIFTNNATAGLNTAIKGIVERGDRVLTSSFEHNSVTRPLRYLETSGVSWKAVPPSADAPLDLDRVRDELRHGGVRLIVVAHASNVTGAVVPLAPLHDLAREHQATLLVDAAQTAGHVPISLRDADVIVCAGHKGLFGPQGTGLLLIADHVAIRPLIHGGTGGRSESPDQPRWLPYALESGTANGVGVAGLGAAIADIGEHGLAVNAEREARLRSRFVDAVRDLPGVQLHQWPSPERPAPVVSITLDAPGPTVATALLEERHEVLARGGLHCAPLAHRTLGTFPEGTIRFSMSRTTTESDVVTAAGAVAEIATYKG